jgi:azurin
MATPRRRVRCATAFLKKSMIACHRLACMAALTLSASLASAADCTVEIEGNDAMQFNKTAIEVGAGCKEFTVKLRHAGKLPRAAMGHNWVLAKTADVPAIVAGGDYLKAADARVVAHTRLIGGGESDSVSFAPARLTAGESYTFFCSFPGHSALMKGSLKLAKS